MRLCSSQQFITRNMYTVQSRFVGQGPRRVVLCVDGLAGMAVWATSHGRNTVFSHPAVPQCVTYWRAVRGYTDKSGIFGKVVDGSAIVPPASSTVLGREPWLCPAGCVDQGQSTDNL